MKSLLMSDFYPLEVVGHGNKTQFHVGENVYRRLGAKGSYLPL